MKNVMLNVRVVVENYILFTFMVKNTNALYYFVNSALFITLSFFLKPFNASVEVLNNTDNVISVIPLLQDVSLQDVPINKDFYLIGRHVKGFNNGRVNTLILDSVDDMYKGIPQKTPFDSRFSVFLNKMYH